jgi:plastocyanin/uncharacterized membrane protein
MVLFDGLPLHPLIVHAPVALIPLVAIGMVVLLVRPSLRATLAPIVAVLAIGAAVTSIGAVWSGEQLGEALGRGDELGAHESWGQMTRTFAVIVALGAAGFAAADRRLSRRPAIASGLGIVTAGLAIAAVAVVGVTGHRGATLSWEGKVPGAGSTDDGEVAVGASAIGGAQLSDGDAVTDPPAVVDDGSATDDSPAAPSASPQLPGAGTPGVDVVLGEWTLVPAVEQAPPGRMTFRFHNRGTVPHALRIRSSRSGGERLEWRSETVQPDGVGLLVGELPAGVYELDCPVEDGHGEHDRLGMETPFTVRDDADPLGLLPDGTVAPQDDEDAGADAGAQAPSEVVTSPTIDIRSFAYEPADLQVSVGTSVMWTNHDPAPHSATGDAFDTGRLEQGGSASVTFADAGTFDYLCTIHPAMRGRVTVVP